MALKIFIVFLMYVMVSVIVESKPSAKLDVVKNEQISVFNSRASKQRQINYIYYPYNGYQSYYVGSIQRPTKHPRRKPSTTQRYSIWDLSRKRRDADSASETGDLKTSQQKDSTDIRKKRQIDDSDIDFGYYPFTFRRLLDRRQQYVEPRNQPHTMWDLTR